MTTNETAGQVQLDPTGRLAQDIHCIHCGYNLRSLLPNQACPECDQPVEPSLHGEMLRFSSPAWLAKLAWGMVWLILGWVLELVWRCALAQLLPRLATGTTTIAVAQAFGYSMQAAQFIGIWMVTWRDPRMRGNSSQLDARILARILLLANWILPVVLWLAALSWRPTPGSTSSMILSLIPSMIWLFGWICLYVHLTRLARRIPATGLVWLTYAGVATMTVYCCFGAGYSLWHMLNSPRGMVPIPPLWVSIFLDWCLLLAYMVLLLAAQILYRMQFRRALRQSRQWMQEANVQPGASS